MTPVDMGSEPEKAYLAAYLVFPVPKAPTPNSDRGNLVAISYVPHERNVHECPNATLLSTSACELPRTLFGGQVAKLLNH